MKRKALFLLMIFFSMLSCKVVGADVGNTVVARWKGDTKGAFTFMFDDSMLSHADIAIPALIERGLVGTFFVNPATSRYKSRQSVWAIDAVNGGQELANHTMTHRGASNYQEAEYEIGQCAKIIWNLRGPSASKILAFSRGGGTTWNISNSELEQIKAKYYSYSRGSKMSAAVDYGTTAQDMINKAQEGADQNRWVRMHTHGIGGEWLYIETNDFLQFVNYLRENRDQIWTGGWSAVYQYIKERDAATVSIHEANSSRIRIRLTAGLNQERFVEPLTLKTEVPKSWFKVTVTQGTRSKVYSASGSRLQYEAVPDKGEIILNPNGATKASP